MARGKVEKLLTQRYMPQGPTVFVVAISSHDLWHHWEKVVEPEPVPDLFTSSVNGSWAHSWAKALTESLVTLHGRVHAFIQHASTTSSSTAAAAADTMFVVRLPLALACVTKISDNLCDSETGKDPRNDYVDFHAALLDRAIANEPRLSHDVARLPTNIWTRNRQGVGEFHDSSTGTVVGS